MLLSNDARYVNECRKKKYSRTNFDKQDNFLWFILTNNSYT